MNKLLCFVLLCLWAANAQENSIPNVPKSLLECYNNTYLLDGNNKLPQNVQSLLAILRKIEDHPEIVNSNWNLRTLSVALLHRFRQDGIIQNPLIPVQAGVTPYAPNGPQFYRLAETLKLIQGNAITFPNNSLSSVERCSLHTMLSSSIEMTKRGDESTSCRNTNAPYRRSRSLRNERSTHKLDSREDDVETLSAEQLEIMGKDNSKDTGVDPNLWYPPLPPNHPDNARLMEIAPQSECPVEYGVIKTEWGPVAVGSVLAGIAAGLQPESVKMINLLQKEWQSRISLSSATLDNKWIATIAGNLAEVALQQGPLIDKPMRLGVEGHWNSTYLPRWYFLSSNDDLSYTAAEIRGDLDGLILADEIAGWYKQFPDLRLSQIIDMYYSDRGVFNQTIRACSRKELLPLVAPNATITAQAFRSALVLSPGVAKVTIDPATIEKFAVQASEKLFTFIPSMNDPYCPNSSNGTMFNRISTDLTIVLDTNRPFASVQPLLAAILEKMEISKYNSNFTVISGHDGLVMINSTDSILSFYEFNETQYSTYRGVFNLAQSFDVVQSMLKKKLDDEHSRGAGGANSQIVLVVPYSDSIPSSDKDYCKQQLKIFYENIPDATFLFLAMESKDSWVELVRDQENDIFLVGSVSNSDISNPVNNLLSRIKEVPKRLINSQCGSSFAQTGSTNSFEDYLEPLGINFYRLHPNYFHNNDAEFYSTVKVQGSSSASLEVCVSRDPMYMVPKSSDCRNVSSNSERITFRCENADFIHDCQPLYLSVRVMSESNLVQRCTSRQFCRYPDMVKYMISYENLLCVNSANAAIVSPIVILLIFMCSYFN